VDHTFRKLPSGGEAIGESPDFTLQFDPERRVLLIAMGRVVTQDSSTAAAAAVRRFFELHETNCVVADLSAVEKVDASARFIWFLAEGPPAVPAGKMTILIAPQDEAYGLSRMFQTIRMDKRQADLQVVRSRKEAYELLDAELSHESPRRTPSGRAC